MWSGVITITMIIAAWAPAITTIAAISSGRSRTTVSAFLHDVCETTGTSAAWRASWRGSGRNATNSTRPAARMPTVPTAKGPVSSGNDSCWAVQTPSPVRLGPATAPIVEAHTTIDSARARECASARSVAAYRLLLLAADVAPSSAAPRSSSVIDSATPPATASMLPAAPMR